MITVIGSLNYDLVSYTTKVPGAGETTSAETFEKHIGGKGLNEAIACARLSQSNTEVRLIGNIGDDMFGKELLEALKKSGVNTSYVKTLEGVSSGVAVIIVETDSGENRILITPGANGLLKPTQEDYARYFDEREVEDMGKNSEPHFVVLQNEYPDTVSSIRWIKQHRPHINIAYNPSPFKAELINKEVLADIDFIIVNEGEASEVAEQLGHERIDEAADLVLGAKKLASELRQYLNQKNCNTVVITLGSKGCVYCSHDGEAQYESSKKIDHVVDTTGAGDTFFGGIISKLVEKQSLENAVKFATVASSITIQGKGAAESIPDLARMREVE